MHAWHDDMQIKMMYERCMQVHGWTQTRLTNLSTTFLHDTIASNWRKALLIIIITKLIMSATNKQLNCQGTSEVFVSQGLQSIQNHT